MPKTKIPPLTLSDIPSRTTPCDERLRELAKDLTLAGAQVLREDFSFDEYQTQFWENQTLIRMKRNRENNSGR